MSYGTPTQRGIRKPNADEAAEIWRLLGENADDTETALDDLEADLNATYAPGRFALDAVEAAKSAVQWSTLAQPTEGTAYHDVYLQSSGAQNDEVVYDLGNALRAGTWTFVLAHVAGNNRGIYTLAISADAAAWTDVGTVDGYAAAETATRSAVTGITVPAATRYLRLKMATKNASSASYFGTFSHASGVRTA